MLSVLRRFAKQVVCLRSVDEACAGAAKRYKSVTNMFVLSAYYNRICSNCKPSHAGREVCEAVVMPGRGRVRNHGVEVMFDMGWCRAVVMSGREGAPAEMQPCTAGPGNGTPGNTGAYRQAQLTIILYSVRRKSDVK